MSRQETPPEAAAAPARPLAERVTARDHLADAAEAVGRRFVSEALSALRDGQPKDVEAAVRRGAASVDTLAESLRTYQAELHAQAAELHDSQARTERALTRFSRLFAHLPLPVLLVGGRAEVLDVNARAQHAFGLRARVTTRRFFHRLVDGEHYQRVVRPAFHEATALGAARCDEVAFVGETGQRFWGELHISALPDEDGHTRFACAVVDRTEQREMLRQLQETNRRLAASEAFLSDSAALARIGGWEYEPDSRRLRWTAQTRAIHEVGDDFEPGVETAIGFYAAESQPRVRAAFETALAAGTDFDLELDLVTARGRTLRVRAVGHPEWRDGRCVRVSGVFQDITRQHQEREAIDTLTRRLDLAREAGGIGIWDCDLRLDRVYVDNGMRSLLGLAHAPTQGLAALFDSVLDEGESARLREALDAALGGEPLAIELHLAAPSDRYVHLAGRAERAGDGTPARLIGCAWDSTADHLAARLLAAKEAAEAASRAKSAFLSRMSHELRTPLNAILGFSQLMRVEAESGDLVVKPHRLQFIETAARHLLELVNEVLDVSAVESGVRPLASERVDAARIARECVPLVALDAEQAGVELAVDIDSPAWVRADPMRLKQVLTHLLSNAIRYNRRGGHVRVTAGSEGDRLQIEVADDGRGMEAGQLGQLFQPFNRVGAERTPVAGAGLSLYVCARVVDRMKGSISVESTPGVGTTFRVRLPAAVPD